MNSRRTALTFFAIIVAFLMGFAAGLETIYNSPRYQAGYDEGQAQADKGHWLKQYQDGHAHEIRR